MEPVQVEVEGPAAPTLLYLKALLAMVVELAVNRKAVQGTMGSQEHSG